MNLVKSIQKRLRRFGLCRDQSRKEKKTLRFDTTDYDEQLFAVMDEVLRPDSASIDVGCHQGTILRQMMERAPRGRHYAFEPLPHLAEHLERQFPSATIQARAVAETSGIAEFVHVENDPAYSGLLPRIYDRPDPKIARITVAVTTIDEAVPAEAAVALIKLDIEGGEYHAIRGALGLIRRWRPYIAFEAGFKSTGQYGVSPEMMHDLLADLGYDVYTLQAWLMRRGPIAKSFFERNWNEGPEYFWLAAPISDKQRQVHVEAA